MNQNIAVEVLEEAKRELIESNKELNIQIQGLYEKHERYKLYEAENKEKINELDKAIKKVLGIHSPSRVTTKLGEHTVN